jgi:hypothetical protein
MHRVGLLNKNLITYFLQKTAGSGKILVLLKRWQLTQMWGHNSVIPALGSLREEDCKFEASLSYIIRPCLKPPPLPCKKRGVN